MVWTVDLMLSLGSDEFDNTGMDIENTVMNAVNMGMDGREVRGLGVGHDPVVLPQSVGGLRTCIEISP